MSGMCVCFDEFDEFTYSFFFFITFSPEASSLLRKFFSSSLSLIFQHRRIKNEPRKTGDVVARARRARRSVSLFILLFLLGLLLSLSVSLISNRLLATDD